MNSKFILSLSMMSFLFLTGCAQRTVTPSTTGTNGVYDTSGTVVYSDSNTYGNSTYGDKTTVITPTDTYTPVYVDSTTSSNSNSPYSTYGTTSSDTTNSTYGSNTSPTYGTGAYSYPSGTTYTYPSSSSSSSSSTHRRTYSDTGTSSSSTQRPYTPARTTSSSSGNATTASNCKGIHLQVASLASSSLAENYRKSLSLSGSQKSYVKSSDGKNRVIICGISSMNEANSLKSTKFPGSFVVSGSATSSSSTTTSRTSSSSSSSYSSSRSSKSGVGIQIGAFSSKAAASSAIASYNGKYSSEIKSNGKTLYKAILKGFKNEAEAKNAISSGKVTGFIVH